MYEFFPLLTVGAIVSVISIASPIVIILIAESRYFNTG